MTQRTTKSSQYLTSVPYPRPPDAHASSRAWNAILASNGEIGEPCGVPASSWETTPPSKIPARSQHRSSFNIRLSDTRRSIRATSAECEISSKQLWMSASSTHTPPLLAATLTASSAWWAERFGRNPKLTGRKSASKIGSSTIRAAAITTRSATHGMPSGRVCPGLPGFGIRTRRSGRRTVASRPQRRSQPVEELAHPGALDLLDGHTIDAGRSPVGTDIAPSPLQYVAAGDLVEQGMETTIPVLLGTAVEHALESTNPVHAISAADGSSRSLGTHQSPSLLPSCIDEAGALRSGRVLLPAHQR